MHYPKKFFVEVLKIHDSWTSTTIAIVSIITLFISVGTLGVAWKGLDLLKFELQSIREQCKSMQQQNEIIRKSITQTYRPIGIVESVDGPIYYNVEIDSLSIISKERYITNYGEGLLIWFISKLLTYFMKWWIKGIPLTHH